MKSTTRGSIVVLAVFGIAMFVGTGVAQEASQGATNPPKPMMENQKAMSDMMARGQQMMASMQAADQKLTELAAAMNAASGNDRLAAVVAVINELVARQKATRDMMTSMMSMHGMMMGSGPMPGTTPKDR